MLRIALPGLLAGSLLCACAEAPGPGMPPARCDVDAAGIVVGETFNSQLGIVAMQRSGALRLRVIRPGQQVTMDYDAGRLSVELDANEKVVAVRCG
jgi:hypothetical protein